MDLVVLTNLSNEEKTARWLVFYDQLEGARAAIKKSPTQKAQPWRITDGVK